MAQILGASSIHPPAASCLCIPALSLLHISPRCFPASFLRPSMDIVGLLSSFAALAFSWLFFSHFRRCLRKDLPPGTMGWPLLGETLEFLASKPTFTTQPFIEKRLSRYGDIFKSHLFGQSLIISTNEEVNQFIFQREGQLFQSCHRVEADSDILGKQTIVDTHGDLHKRLHGMVAQALNQEGLKGLVFDFIQTQVMKRLPTWQDQIVHVQHEATSMVLGLLLDRLVSQDPDSSEVQQLHLYCNDVKSLLAFPYNVPGSGYSKHTQGRLSLKKYFKEKIAKRRNLNQFESNDLLDALLKEEVQGSSSINSKVILDNIVGFLFHGEETTGMAMTLVMKFLSESPKAFNQLREEHMAIRKKKKEDEKLSWEDYQSMNFTRNVINESLRITNVVPWVFRVATQDVEIKGYTIPKGWKVMVFLMGTHFDASVYHDPKTFNPWRWQQNSISDAYFTPFGKGPRLCPGAELAKVIMAVFLHFLVTKYSWQLVEEDDIIRFPVLTLQEGLPIVVKHMNDEDECLILH